jgi:hypothetical protein
VPSDSGVSHERRADKLLRRVAGHDERQGESGCRLARERPHQRNGVVASHMRHAGRAVRCNAGGDLDRSARVDGDSLHPERPALRADALSIYGTYYLAMILPVFAFGDGIVPSGFYGWLALGAVILLGSRVIWWATERAWGKFS